MLTTSRRCRNAHAQQHDHCNGPAAPAGSNTRADGLAHCHERTDAQRQAEGSSAWMRVDCAALLHCNVPQNLAAASSKFDAL